MDKIRPTYSGLIFLTIGLSGVFTSLIFTVVVTRNLSQLEFGTWGLINSILIYGTIGHTMTSFWTTREITRKIDTAKTALFSNSTFSLGGIAIYTIIAYFISLQTEADIYILLLGIVLIPLTYFNKTFMAINMSWKPHVVSYGNLTFAIIQIPMVIIFVYFMEMGVSGVIATTAIARLSSIVVLALYAKKKIQNPIKFGFIKKWLRLSWISVYPSVIGLLTLTDVIIFSIITGSVKAVALWVAAFAIASIVTHIGRMGQASIPKLLREEGTTFLQSNMRYVFYFGILITGLVVAFSQPAMFLLNPIYEKAYFVSMLLGVTIFLRTLSNTFIGYLIGDEKVDKYKQSTFRDYSKSTLFFLPTLQLAKLAVYLSILSIGIFLLMQKSFSFIDLVIFWSMLSLLVEIPLTLYFYYRVTKKFQIKIPFVLLKYLAVALVVFSTSYFLINEFLEYHPAFFDFLPQVVMYAVLAILSYLGITYLIDSHTRSLFKAVIAEVRKKV